MLDVFPDKKSAKLKTRARKGIPDSIRGFAWQILSQSNKAIGNLDKVKHF